MSLASDYGQQILVDSTFRNRSQFPYPSSFEVTVKPQNTSPTDPIGDGYLLYTDVVGPGPTGVPYATVVGNDMVGLVTGISPLTYEDRLLLQYIDFLDPTTRRSLGTSQVTGFGPRATTTSPITYFFIKPPITNGAAVIINGTLALFRQRKSRPAYSGLATVITAIGGTSVTIPGGSNVDGAYVGMYLRDVQTAVPPGAHSWAGASLYPPNVYRITAYTGSTHIATISPPYNDAGGIAIGDQLEIYNVADNEVGASVMGSISNRSTMVNHEITLEWIRIPRHSLNVYEVSTITPNEIITVNSFIYLIVEFHNKSFGSTNVVQSNSSHTRKAQFIVPVEDLSTSVGKFFTLRGKTIVMKFDPSDTLVFKVTLPDGNLIKFDPEDETGASLAIPNPDMQISALFTVKRVLTNVK